MARRDRETQPSQTKSGIIASYSDLDRLLTEGEVRGRQWIHTNAKKHETAFRADADDVIWELHREMFGSVYELAGSPRTEDLGPGGMVNVPHWKVREELRKLAGDLVPWLRAIQGSEDVGEIARVVADYHHRFQWIHPFRDTNGRTGRVLDHLLLWWAFGLGGDSVETSPLLEYFPDESHETQYCDGLTEADHHRPELLRSYYADRIAAAVDILQG